MDAIILDGSLKSALTTARSLGERGVLCSAGAENMRAMTLHSRFVREKFLYPSPLSDEAGFISAVQSVATRAREKPVILSFSDATTSALWRARKVLEQSALPLFPGDRSFEIAFDKVETYGLARSLSIPTIETHLPEEARDAERVAAGLRYPAVVKPRASITWQGGRGFFGSAKFVHSPEELVRHCVASNATCGAWPMVQPWIRGAEYGFEALVDTGRIALYALHRRVRSLSPTGGAAVLKESLGVSSETEIMRTHAEKIITALSWHGPIMIEFKINTDGHVMLMEINGRFWGSLPLTVAAGADVPYGAYRLARGVLPGGEPLRARAGVITRHYLGDVRHLLRVLFAHDAMRPLSYPSRFAAMHDFFLPPPGTKSDVWSIRDPLPAFWEVLSAIKI